jgi:hypothetical protein
VLWLLLGLIFGLLLLLLYGLSYGLFLGLVFGSAPCLSNELVVYVQHAVQLSVLISGLTFGLIGAMFGGLRSEISKTKTVPNQGVRLSARNAVFAGLIFALVFALVLALVYALGYRLIFEPLYGPDFGLIYGLVNGLVFGLSCGGLAALWYGCFDIIQHYTLRLILHLKGHTPRDYIQFLDYASQRIFLRKVGGGYMFVHRLLLDYFAMPDEDAMAYYTRAIAHYSSNDLEKAILDFTRTIKLDPDNALAYHDRGIAYQVAGDLEQALADYTKATELDPDKAEYWDSLCWLSNLSGRAASGMYACERAVELASADGQIRDSRGLARALVGDYDGAIEDFKFYIEWSKENDQYEQYGSKREVWVTELEAGQNPFNEITLEELGNETVSDLTNYFASLYQGE